MTYIVISNKRLCHFLHNNNAKIENKGDKTDIRSYAHFDVILKMLFF